ncbi:unnamed protein product [Rotaria sp. Silwood1]|nr:unnamed protein product [Rotaria sp. Silwood1]
MFRDLFLWSVYTRRIGTAFVLLLHIKARTGAALLAVALAKRKASFTKEMNQRTDFMDHAAKYEDYATACINACHQQSEQRTSSILLSKKKIYGDATYMQIAIASNIRKFITTNSVDKALDEKWFAYPLPFMIRSLWNKCLFGISIFLLGLSAPFFFRIDFSSTSNKQQKQTSHLNTDKTINADIESKETSM